MVAICGRESEGTQSVDGLLLGRLAEEQLEVAEEG